MIELRRQFYGSGRTRGLDLEYRRNRTAGDPRWRSMAPASQSMVRESV